MYGYHETNYGYKGHTPLFQNVVFEGNRTKWTTDNYNNRGGAVSAYYGSNPYFRDVTFKNNLTDYRGGAVFIDSPDTNKTITFERTNFVGNKVSQEHDGGNAQGGAVYLGNYGKAVFESSTFDSNYVEMNGECCNNYGGAIYSQHNFDSLIVRNTKLRYNKIYKPSGNNGGQAYGGAISVRHAYGDVEITNSLFEGNSAEGGYQTYTNGGNDNMGYGGAVSIFMQQHSVSGTYLYPWQSIIANNTFINNKALGSGNNGGTVATAVPFA